MVQFECRKTLSLPVIFLLFAVLFFLGSCQTDQASRGTHKEPVTLPQEARLRERIQAFHHALGDNDIATWYAMTTPAVRERMTFEQFKKDLRWDENAAKRPKVRMQAELAKACSCEPQRYLRCVLVIDVKTQEPGGTAKTEKPLEMWEFADGEWFWGYLGPDTRGRCPGDR